MLDGINKWIVTTKGTVIILDRPLKYRAWDGEHFSTVQLLSFNDDYYGYQAITARKTKNDNEFTWTYLPNDIIAIEQYTGIDDADGKEIYEGDIVRFTAGEESNGYFEHDYTGKIVFEDGSFWLKNKYVYPLHQLLENDAVMNVIGDIHTAETKLF